MALVGRRCLHHSVDLHGLAGQVAHHLCTELQLEGLAVVGSDLAVHGLCQEGWLSQGKAGALLVDDVDAHGRMQADLDVALTESVFDEQRGGERLGGRALRQLELGGRSRWDAVLLQDWLLLIELLLCVGPRLALVVEQAPQDLGAVDAWPDLSAVGPIEVGLADIAELGVAVGLVVILSDLDNAEEAEGQHRAGHDGDDT